MSLQHQIAADMKTAMKSKEKEKISVLRMLLSEIKYAQAAVSMSEELPDSEVLKVVNGYHKKLTKSLKDYPEGEQKKKIEEEIIIIDAYLPKKATAEEVVAVVDKLIQEGGIKPFGVLMKEVLAVFGTSADGAVVSKILKDRLG